MKCKRNASKALSLVAIMLFSLIIAVLAVDTTIGNVKNSEFNISAKGFAFNVSTMTVPAGANMTINFDNMDPGVEHNFAVYETPESTKPIFRGDEITGPSKISYKFMAPIQPGSYSFRCDDHPGQMNGNFVVK